MTETQKYTCTITSDCTCEIYDEDTDSTKLDEYGEPARPEYCYGECYTEAVYDFTDNFLPMWLDYHKLDKDGKVLLFAGGIGWNKVSATGFVDVSDIHKVMQIDGDFRNVFTIEGGELYAIRYSHDEPVGSGKWNFQPAGICDRCGDGIPADVYEDENGICADCKDY